MSNAMDHCLLSNIPSPHIAALPKVTAQTIEERIGEAMQRMQIAVSDSYEQVSVFSIYWESDDTGGKEDSDLFIETLKKLPNVQAVKRGLSNHVRLFRLETEIDRAAEQSEESRKLFIFHYAGHAIQGSTPDRLIITPKIGQELGEGPQMDMSHIKDGLKDMCSKSLGLDVLFVMDSCCAAIAGRGGKAKGARVEFLAATSRKGISNSREDGRTFTQHWCEAFTKLLGIGEPFTCADIIKELIPDSELELFPSMFVLREGWDLPITFRLHPSIEPSFPAAVTSQMVVTAFHVEENPGSLPLNQLIDYLKKTPVPITVLAALPISSTLLLLCIPVFLQEFLVLPQVAFVLTDS